MRQVIKKLLSNISMTQEESDEMMLKIMSGELMMFRFQDS